MNKLVNTKKLILRIWLILWAILIILLIMKYCFNMWYPITINNRSINNFFNFLDNHNVIKIIVYYILYILSGNIIFLSYVKKFRLKCRHHLVYSILLLLTVALKTKLNFIGVIIEILIIVISIIYNIKTRTYHRKFFNIASPIIIYLLINLWQLNIYLIRDFNLEALQNLPSMYSIVLMLDYYIFLIITWIGVNYMGILSFGWLFGKDVTELEALKAEELNKKNPDKELIEHIDSILASKKED